MAGFCPPRLVPAACGVARRVPRSQLWSAGGRLKAVYAVLVLVSSAPFVHRTECHVSVMGLDKAGWRSVVSLVDWSSARGGVTNTLPVKWAPRKSVDLGLTLHRDHVVPPCVLSVAVDGFWFAPLFKSVQVLLLSVLSCGQSVSLPVYMLYSLLLLVTFISFIFLSMVSRSDMRDNITQDVVLSYGRDTSTLFHFISFHYSMYVMML